MFVHVEKYGWVAFHSYSILNYRRVFLVRLSCDWCALHGILGAAFWGSLWATWKSEDLSLGNAWGGARDCTCHWDIISHVNCRLRYMGSSVFCLFLAMITIFVWHDLQGESNYAICKCCQYLAHGLGCEKKQGQGATEKLILLIDIYTSSSLQSKVRKEFSDAYRGTVCEGSQNLVHWILCLLFMLETVVAAECITKIRSRAFSDPEGSTFGISNGTLVLLAKYAITLNIKLVDSIWTPLSTWLSKKENWRTETDLKANMVVKLFAVKFVVFYYPFAFTIFVQPYEAEGCDGGEMSGRMHVWQLQTHASTAFLQIHQIPWGHCLLDSNDQRKFACDSSVALSECLRWLHTSRDYPRHGKLAELGCGKWIAHRAPLKDQKVPAAAFLFHTAARLRVKVEIRPLFFLRLPSTSDAIAETIGMQRPSSREASVHLSFCDFEWFQDPSLSILMDGPSSTSFGTAYQSEWEMSETCFTCRM